MAYDVDRRPAGWVGRQARRHAWGVYCIVGLLVLTSLVSLVVALSPTRSVLAGAAVLVAIGLLKIIGERKSDLAVRWRRGWVAEKTVGEELNRLQRDGFIVTHDVPQRGEGNIDHIVRGPTAAYLIETKAQAYQHEQLAKARRQAAKLSAELGTWVTPVICLHDRDSTPYRHQRVWIVPRQHIVDWIRERRS